MTATTTEQQPACASCDDACWIVCPNCSGAGVLTADDGQTYDCSLCYGMGEVECEECPQHQEA